MAGNGLNWFRPMWRRVAIVAICAIWSGWEWFSNQDQFWGTLTLALTGYAIWTFFITFDKNVGPPALPDRDGKNLPPPDAPKS